VGLIGYKVPAEAQSHATIYSRSGALRVFIQHGYENGIRSCKKAQLLKARKRKRERKKELGWKIRRESSKNVVAKKIRV
jgi:hypothetical protein